MLIIQDILTENIKHYPREQDAVHLDWEARQKCRQRLRTEAGRELSYVDRNGGICLMKCGEDGGLIPVA